MTRAEATPLAGFEGVFASVSGLDAFRKASDTLRRGGNARLGGVWGGSFSLVVEALRREGKGKGTLIVLTPSVDEADDIRKDLTLFGAPTNHVRSLAPVDGPDASGRLADPRRLSRNLSTLRALASADARPEVVLIPLACAIRPVLPRMELTASLLEVTQEGEIDRDEWLQQLADSGLERTDLVSTPGEFSVRGGIVDIFAFSEPKPIRIELDGDFIDSIRRIDPSTQRSVEVLESIEIPLVGRTELLQAELDPTNLLDYFEPDDRVIARNTVEMEERLERYEDVEDSIRTLLIGPDEERGRLDCSTLPIAGDEATGGNLSVGSITAEGASLESAMALVGRLVDTSERVLLFCQSEAEGKRFGTLLERQETPGLERVEIRVGDLSHGFQFHELSLTLVDHHELFHRVRPRKREMLEPEPTLPIDDHLQLKKGDHIVHAFHGIARYRGLERMASGEAEQEFLSLEFQGGMKLYVPISKIHLVERYVGSKGREPRLSKLGGAGWAKRKKTVEDSVTEFATKLLETMAIRSKREGISFPPDTEWQHEFEAAFPYKDTPDQQEASVLVKQDMEASKPMDRLICGDVGYGKTEIAMRASFKAVESGRQVAILVPTTVLAQQHLQSFRERMSDYPVEVEALSRIRTGRETKKILENAKSGHLDILIGTHRLLQRDVEFKDLGLVIVDEEQRFGVVHKAALMAIRATVDLLTLTATPIPRTLHMAMVSLRDISTLSTPPQGRQAIHTQISRFDDQLVKDAIEFELERDGQVFFIHNRVKTIDRMKHKLEELVPLARIEYIHGQMDEHLVEERMTRFVEGEIDVLLATTIIESGLDIPNANTIFIDRADRFGLAELHQLRGRVGRYRKKAYAYLLVPPRGSISTEAQKRLKAIEEYSDLGAGFRIAMRDMEIRGAGNLLGSEQHGHIAAIGYELYCRLLRDAVRRLRGEKVPPAVETDIDFGVPAFIPIDYIPDTRQKVEIYQKIAASREVEELDRLREECRDRFGPVPEEVDNLLWQGRVRPLLQENQVESVKRRGSRLILTLPVGLTPSGLARRGTDEVRRIDGKTLHLLLPPRCQRLRDVVPGLERALSGDGFFEDPEDV